MPDNGTVKQAGARGRLTLILKLVVTVALVAVLLNGADWVMVRETLQTRDPFWIGVAFLIMVLSVTISAYKWRLLLQIHGIQYPFNTLHRYYFVAMFFNNFLPTSIGGDGYRIYRTWHNRRAPTGAVFAVVMERLTGMAALFGLGLLAALTHLGDREDPLAVAFVGLALVGVIAVGLSLPMLRRGRLLRILPARLARLGTGLREYMADYKRARTKTGQVVLTSFVFQLNNCLPFYVLLSAVAPSISFLTLLMILALVNFAAVLPISINGIGVVEVSFVYLTGLYGVAYEHALVVAILIRALVIPLSLTGGLLYLLERTADKHEGART